MVTEQLIGKSSWQFVCDDEDYDVVVGWRLGQMFGCGMARTGDGGIKGMHVEFAWGFAFGMFFTYSQWRFGGWEQRAFRVHEGKFPERCTTRGSQRLGELQQVDIRATWGVGNGPTQ